MIVAFNKTPVEDYRHVQRLVADSPVGKTVTLEILRTAGFGPVGSIVWAGVLFLGADAVVEVTLLRQARRHLEPGPPGGEDDASEERQVASSVS